MSGKQLRRQASRETECAPLIPGQYQHSDPTTGVWCGTVTPTMRGLHGMTEGRSWIRRLTKCCETQPGVSLRTKNKASQPTICTSNFRKTFQVVDADLVFLDPVGSSVFRRVARCSVYCVSAFLRFYIRVRKCELWLAIRGRPQRHNRGRT